MKTLFLVLIGFLSTTVQANTAEELRNIETLNRWCEVWISGNYKLVFRLVGFSLS